MKLDARSRSKLIYIKAYFSERARAERQQCCSPRTQAHSVCGYFADISPSSRVLFSAPRGLNYVH